MKLNQSRVGIVDLGIGNLGSINNMLKRLGFNAKIISSPKALRDIEKIILPGVGHFDHGMGALIKTGFREELDEAVQVSAKPVLGVCLGAQMLGHGSEEGDLPGLGYIDMESAKFKLAGYPVPHMGWNTLNFGGNHGIKKMFITESESRFYFVHSFRMICDNSDSSLATTTYGGVEFSSFVRENNVYGAQFHPEKSLRFGKAFLRGFMENV